MARRPAMAPGAGSAFDGGKNTFLGYGPSSHSAEERIETLAPRIHRVNKRLSMKMLRLLSSILGLAGAGALHAADNPASRTEVVFDHPEKFTDVKDSYSPTEKGQAAILADIRNSLVSRTESLIPEGYKLKINDSVRLTRKLRMSAR